MTTKTDYQRLFEVVRVLIQEWDPSGLIAGGAPLDEFDSEVARIVAQVPRIASPADAALAISGVFSSAFHPEGFTPGDCAGVGEKLYKTLREKELIA